MYEILLHIGLPKTATSSLQTNVLMPLHTQRRINFLGKSFCDGTMYDPFQEVFNRIRERPLTAGAWRRLRPVVEAMLDPVRPNVISNEAISAGRVVHDDGTVRDPLILLDNLAALFRGDDVRILVSFRSPVDYVLSAYAEGYYWDHYASTEYGTIDRFVGHLLRHDRESAEWIVFHCDAYLRAVARHFDRIQVLLYEDLHHDPSSYFSQLAAWLHFDPHDVQRMFLQTRRNPGVYTRRGKRSRPLTMKHLVQKYCPGVRRYYEGCRPILERIPLLLPLCRRLASMETSTVVEHSYPDGEMTRLLIEHLGVRTDYLAKMHGVSEEKLARYGYLHPAHPSHALSGV